MPFKITNITRKPSADVPDFDEWLHSLDSSFLKNYPEVAGKTPAEVIEEHIPKHMAHTDPVLGFVSERSWASEDNLTWYYESVWESKSHWQNATLKLNTKNTQDMTVEDYFGSDLNYKLYENAAYFIKKSYLTIFNVPFPESIEEEF